MSNHHPQTLALLVSAALNSTPPGTPPGSVKGRSEPPPDDRTTQSGSTPSAAAPTPTETYSVTNAQSGPSSTSKPKTKPRSSSSASQNPKSFTCTNVGCNKQYKQYNGLKYHQSKGQCDFTVRDAHFLGLTAQEVEDSRRPHVCIGGDGCTKRYRQRNGLKYHYLHSGLHGKQGLEMLRDGTHPTPKDLPPDALSPISP